jgi:hypothetical protein
MKALIFFSIFLLISCGEKEETFPVKVIGEELLHNDPLNGCFYLFTFRNEGDAIVDSFKVDISLYEDGLQVTSSRNVREELVPFASTVRSVFFPYVIKNDSNVSFKYRFK